jgi:hypothetical protein
MTNRFKQITAVSVTDVITGELISVVYALDDRGFAWRKVGTKDWERISGPGIGPETK